MNWQFWKKQTSVSHNPKINVSPSFLFNEESNSSFSSWDEGLSSYPNMKSYLISQDTTSALVSISNHIRVSKYINKDSSVTKQMKQVVEVEMEQAVMKDKILKNLHRILDDLDKECEEEGFEKFSEIARKNAKRILNFIYTKFSNYDYAIYPTSNQEIFITCNPQKGKGVSILCDSNGGVAYFLTWDGKNSRHRCDEVSRLFYHLLIEVFKKFDSLTQTILSISSKDSDFLHLKKSQISSF